ncbi:hypothetical protein TNCV_3350701 [Trichonephila clavipes]|nr:hypothetical protein TNCV_3350701 [Trichonephila clavipes]
MSLRWCATEVWMYGLDVFVTSPSYNYAKTVPTYPCITKNLYKTEQLSWFLKYRHNHQFLAFVSIRSWVLTLMPLQSLMMGVAP